MKNIIPVGWFFIEEAVFSDTVGYYSVNMILEIDVSKTDYYLTESEILYSEKEENKIEIENCHVGRAR